MALETARHARVQPQATKGESDNVVAFVPPANDGLQELRGQEYGKIFSAHRIAARISDQLDTVAVL